MSDGIGGMPFCATRDKACSEARDNPGTTDSGPKRSPRWRARLGAIDIALARSADEIAAVQKLRAERFRGAGTRADTDAFDPHCAHLLITKDSVPPALATARLRHMQGTDIWTASYSAQFYDLSALVRSNRTCLEIGRICIDPAHVADPDVLRALLAGLARAAQDTRAEILMGCASFPGADAQRHGAALAYLAAQHLGPTELRPDTRTVQSVALRQLSQSDRMTTWRQVPALLRLYLGLGGWVSDHAVIDHELDTLHVFTAVEVSAIPALRVQSLRKLCNGMTSENGDQGFAMTVAGPISVE